MAVTGNPRPGTSETVALPRGSPSNRSEKWIDVCRILEQRKGLSEGIGGLGCYWRTVFTVCMAVHVTRFDLSAPSPVNVWKGPTGPT